MQSVWLSLFAASIAVVNADSVVIGCSEEDAVVTSLNGSLSSTFGNGGGKDGYRRCTWTINAPPDRRVLLTLPRGLDVEESAACREGYLSIYDGSSVASPEIGTWCGKGMMEPITSSGSSLHIVFEEKTTVNGPGLLADFTMFSDGGDGSCSALEHACESKKACIPKGWMCDGQNDCADGSDERSCVVPDSIQLMATTTTSPNDEKSGCGGLKHVIGHSGNILSHEGFGATTYPESSCAWSVTPPAGKVTKLTFNSFDLENSPGCHYDYLRIYNGDSEDGELVANLCGTKTIEPIMFNETLYLAFKADSIMNRGGFNISYNFVLHIDEDFQPPTTESPVDLTQSGCGGQRYFSNETGSITTKNYGVSNYPGDSFCEWNIAAPEGKVVNIEFHDFKLERSSNCAYDHVTIYDGINSSFPVIASICGSSLPSPIFASGNSMYIVFVSDSSLNAAGFNATFSYGVAPVTCSANEFTCGNGHCVPVTHRCDGESDCTDGTDEIFCSQGKCGQPAVPPKPGNSRIYGGTEANRNSWPWQVMLKYQNVFTCGGSLISPQWVATASHCIHQTGSNPADWSAILGKHSKSRSDPEEVHLKIVKVIEHPKYDSQTDNNDLALLQLETAVAFDDKVQPICLPTMNLAPGYPCFVTGWGDVQGTGNPDVLKQAAVPVMSNEECLASGWIPQVTTDQFCAGLSTGGHDACQGDSGGPLACQVNGAFELQGVVSFGIGCGLLQAPGVYTKVTNYNEWIKDTVARNS